MSNFILLDAQNLFYRARHVTQGDVEIKGALALHIILNSVKKVWRDFKADHLVVALEGGSWRSDIYEPYKKHRKVKAELRTQREKDDDEYFYSVINEFIKFLREKTNVTLLQEYKIEADDWIARWTQLHPDDQCIIVSSDSDFFQLLSEKVSIYDGIKQHLLTHNQVLDDKGNPVRDKHNEPINPPNPEWELFSKIVRGDSGDNVMSAYPGVRDKGTSKKTGLLEAFEDRHDKGYSYNNLMQSVWQDHLGTEHKVLDDYNRNKQLIDLTCQPPEIKQKMDELIEKEINKEPKVQVGIWFLRFCSKYGLDNAAKFSKDYVEFLSAPIKRN